MGQQSLIYAFVARGTVVLAEYTEFTGNFTTIAAQCLQKLPASNNKFTYNCDGHTFNYLVEDGFTYCVVAVESIGRQTPIAFLDRVKDDFTKRYGGGKAATAGASSLNREFGSKLKENMQYCVDNPEEINKLAKVKAQVSEVKGVMMENIEKVLDRGEKIELLVDKTENLRSQKTGHAPTHAKHPETQLDWKLTGSTPSNQKNKKTPLEAPEEPSRAAGLRRRHDRRRRSLPRVGEAPCRPCCFLVLTVRRRERRRHDIGDCRPGPSPGLLQLEIPIPVADGEGHRISTLAHHQPSTSTSSFREPPQTTGRPTPSRDSYTDLQTSSMVTEQNTTEAGEEAEDKSQKRGHRRRLAGHAQGHQKRRPQGTTNINPD